MATLSTLNLGVLELAYFFYQVVNGRRKLFSRNGFQKSLIIGSGPLKKKKGFRLIF